MHRDDMTEAKEKLEASEKFLLALEKQAVKDSRVADEGAHRAALEEYTEAVLFFQFLTKGEIGEVTSLAIDHETYVGGLCDVPGELYRYAIKSATEKNIAMVKKCAEMGEEIVGALIEFNLTSYLRNKFDQAKQAVQKLEQVVYETTIRN
jgi:translin